MTSDALRKILDDEDKKTFQEWLSVMNPLPAYASHDKFGMGYGFHQLIAISKVDLSTLSEERKRLLKIYEEAFELDKKLSEMKIEEITAGNKLIAEFMGGFFRPKVTGEEKAFGRWKEWDITAYGYFDSEDLKYHCSWDWLMPVIKKVAEGNNNVIPWSICLPLMNTLDVKAVWEGVVTEVIKQLNKY